MFPEGRALEFLVAAIVALIVVGPKDLPVLLRKLGQFMAKVRAMAAEFRASFDEMARQSELDDLRKEVEAMRHGQLTDMATHAPEVNQAFNEISQGLSDVGVELNAPAPYTYGAPETTIEVKPQLTPRARKAASAKAQKAAAAKKSAARKTSAGSTATPKAKTPAKPKAAAPKVVAKTTPAKRPAKTPAAEITPAKPRAKKASTS